MKAVIPKLLPNQLPAEAAKLYSRIVRDYGRTIQRFTDEPTIAAAEQIAAAGLGQYSFSDTYGGSLWVTALHQHFTVVDGERPWGLHAEVYLTDGAERGTEVLLAVLRGATFDAGQHDGPLRTWRLLARHVNATDFEHDTCIVGEIKIENPLVDRVGRTTEYLGRIVKTPRLYPLGAGPFDDDDHEARGAGGADMCSNDRCTPHPFGSYMPPKREELRDLRGHLVRIKVTDMALTDADGKVLPLTDDEG